MKTRKSVRILKKVKAENGSWKFVTAAGSGHKYIWDKRPGQQIQCNRAACYGSDGAQAEGQGPHRQ